MAEVRESQSIPGSGAACGTGGSTMSGLSFSIMALNSL